MEFWVQILRAGYPLTMIWRHSHSSPNWLTLQSLRDHVGALNSIKAISKVSCRSMEQCGYRREPAEAAWSSQEQQLSVHAFPSSLLPTER